LLLIVVAGGSYAISCAGYGPFLGIEWVCDQAGFFLFLKAVVAALGANQAAWLISPGVHS